MNILFNKKGSLYLRVFTVGAIVIIGLNRLLIANAAITATLSITENITKTKANAIASTTYADEDGYNLKVIVVAYSGKDKTGTILETASGESVQTAYATTAFYKDLKSAYSKHEVCYATGGVYKKTTKTKNR